MIEQVAKALFANGAAERVIACVMSRDRAHMHLDTVFTLLDRDKATAYPQVVDNIRAISLRPGSRARATSTSPWRTTSSAAVADALGVDKLHVVETGGDAYQQEREQWDDGNNVVALEPGVVVAYERNTYTIAKMREAGVEVVEIAGLRARQGPRRRPLHDVPAPAGPGVRGATMDRTERRPLADRRGRGPRHRRPARLRPQRPGRRRPGPRPGGRAVVVVADGA